MGDSYIMLGEEEEEAVWVDQVSAAFGSPWPFGWEYDVVVPLTAYDGDLGMRTRAALRRQLKADLPRSVVSVAGRRVLDPSRLRVSHPRMCTQAVLAPPLEWLLRSGIVAHELPGGKWPMVVDADDEAIRVSKRLAIRPWDAEAPTGPRGTLFLSVHADVVHGVAVVSFAWSEKMAA